VGEISVRWDGIDEAIAALQAWAEREQLATAKATGDAGDDVQRLARGNFVGAHAPGFPHTGGDRPNTATGRLQASIVPTPVAADGDGRYTVLVGPTTIYGRIIELGGTIHPREAEYLSWFSPWLHRRMYLKEVTLGGWPYLSPAFNTFVETRMTDLYSEAWSAATVA
jgi:hypothetical protein